MSFNLIFIKSKNILIGSFKKLIFESFVPYCSKTIAFTCLSLYFFLLVKYKSSVSKDHPFKVCLENKYFAGFLLNAFNPDWVSLILYPKIIFDKTLKPFPRILLKVLIFLWLSVCKSLEPITTSYSVKWDKRTFKFSNEYAKSESIKQI